MNKPDPKIIDINEIPKLKRSSKWKREFKKIPPNKALQITDPKEATRAITALNALKRKNQFTHLKGILRNKKCYIINTNKPNSPTNS